MSTTTLTAFLGVTALADVGYRFLDASGVFSGARQTAGVYELAGARGVYGINNPTIPVDATKVYWDSLSTFAAYAYEQLDLCITRLLVDRTTVHAGSVGFGNGIAVGAPPGSPAISIGKNGAESIYLAGALGIDGGAYLTSPDGIALEIHSNGTNAPGVIISAGGGSGAALQLEASGGAGLSIQGNYGIKIQATGMDCAGVYIDSTLGDGVDIVGANTALVLYSLTTALDIQGTFIVNGPTTFQGPVVATHVSNDFRLGATERTNIANAVDVKLTAEHDDGSWAGGGGGGGGGTGAYAITLTVVDTHTPTPNPVPGVTVAVYHKPDGALVGSGVTGATAPDIGKVTIGVDAGTYRVVLVHPLYYFAPEDRTVLAPVPPATLPTGTLDDPLVMVQATVPAGPPGTVGLSGTIRDEQGIPVVGCLITVELVPATDVRPITAQGTVISFRRAEIITNASGFAGISLIPTNSFDQTVTYKITSDGGELDSVGVTITAPMDFEDLSP